MIASSKYVRKPLYVDAIQVTPENFKEAAEWASGEVVEEGEQKFIQVRVSNPMNLKQSQAHVGDWILYTPRGYKVYTNKAFKNSFSAIEGTQRDEATQAEKPKAPDPAEAKRTETPAPAEAAPTEVSPGVVASKRTPQEEEEWLKRNAFDATSG